MALSNNCYLIFNIWILYLSDICFLILCLIPDMCNMFKTSYKLNEIYSSHTIRYFYHLGKNRNFILRAELITRLISIVLKPNYFDYETHNDTQVTTYWILNIGRTNLFHMVGDTTIFSDSCFLHLLISITYFLYRKETTTKCFPRAFSIYVYMCWIILTFHLM